MTDKLQRTTTGDVEVRSAERIIYGIAVPFDDPTEVDDRSGRYVEVFRRGAFARTIAERGDKVKALANHDRQRFPIGRAVLLREDAAGLYGEFKVSRTREGDEVLELVADGALDAFSIGFRPIRNKETTDSTHRRLVERLEAALHEVSVVAFPAYAGAAIAGVRSQPDRVALWRRRIALLEAAR